MTPAQQQAESCATLPIARGARPRPGVGPVRLAQQPLLDGAADVAGVDLLLVRPAVPFGAPNRQTEVGPPWFLNATPADGGNCADAEAGCPDIDHTGDGTIDAADAYRTPEYLAPPWPRGPASTASCSTTGSSRGPGPRESSSGTAPAATPTALDVTPRAVLLRRLRRGAGHDPAGDGRHRPGDGRRGVGEAATRTPEPPSSPGARRRAGRRRWWPGRARAATTPAERDRRSRVDHDGAGAGGGGGAGAGGRAPPSHPLGAKWNWFQYRNTPGFRAGVERLGGRVHVPRGGLVLGRDDPGRAGASTTTRRPRRRRSATS